MMRGLIRLLLVGLCLLALPQQAPAPLIYVPGEGWRYEPVGGGAWRRDNPRDQLAVAIAAFEGGDYGLAIKAARRIVRHPRWRFSDYAPDAQYVLGRSYEARGDGEKAFKAYQELLTKYPRINNFDEIIVRQLVIADQYLAGKWFKLWGLIPFFPSMDKTIKMYEQIIKNGPYSTVAPYAQLRIGAANEKRKPPQYEAAARAYNQAADRYAGEPAGIDGLFKEATAYLRQSKRAEYDQSAAAQAIATFSDFITLYPDDPRVAEAQKHIAELKLEQARGAMNIARYYEKRGHQVGALIYYNEVLLKAPGSKLDEQARRRIDSIKQRLHQ
jgi:outer membrane protein assembly factor BamD